MGNDLSSDKVPIENTLAWEILHEEAGVSSSSSSQQETMERVVKGSLANFQPAEQASREAFKKIHYDGSDITVEQALEKPLEDNLFKESDLEKLSSKDLKKLESALKKESVNIFFSKFFSKILNDVSNEFLSPFRMLVNAGDTEFDADRFDVKQARCQGLLAQVKSLELKRKFGEIQPKLSKTPIPKFDDQLRNATRPSVLKELTNWWKANGSEEILKGALHNVKEYKRVIKELDDLKNALTNMASAKEASDAPVLMDTALSNNEILMKEIEGKEKELKEQLDEAQEICGAAGLTFGVRLDEYAKDLYKQIKEALSNK